MPSRRKRKRERRQKLAEATADSQVPKGWGQGLPVSAYDMAMVRRAIHQRWPVPQPIRRAVVADLVAHALLDLREHSTQSARRLCRFVRVCIEMEAENQAAEVAAWRKQQPVAPLLLFLFEPEK